MRKATITNVVYGTFISIIWLPACGGSDGKTTIVIPQDAGEMKDVVDVGDSGDSNSKDAPDGTTLWDGSECPTDRQCGEDCCKSDQFCALGQSCAPLQESCSGADDCWFDSYCLDGECVPFEMPPDHDHDETCAITINIDSIVPQVQCRWEGPPAADAHPKHFQVMSTPIVVDFNFDDDPSTLHPSIVFPSFPTSGAYHQPGVLRVIDGATCEQQHSLHDPDDAIMAPASVAVGDIDGDDRAEIVAAAHEGGVIAFRYDSSAGEFSRMWRSGTCDGSGNVAPDATGGFDKWGGPSIHDLDDDGSAEIVYGGVVYGADGCIKSATLGFSSYHKGIVPVIADVDEDGAMEIVFGSGIYEWSVSDGDWVAETYFEATGMKDGQVAVAELGNFPVAALQGKDHAEVVVVANGRARVQTLDGAIVFPNTSLPGGGTGGPPTVADFDGDGRREFATAGGNEYIVFDFDCLAGGDPAGCNDQSKSDGILWTQPSHDFSSNVTGSSVFDFDANGSAEAVYADECYLRIYDGKSGDVVFSAARSSGTTYENPVIVDVDGDYRTEIVSSVNNYSTSLSCPDVDPLNPSVSLTTNHGIVVLRDVEDRWAASRPIWNQHAYAVTHVGDQGQIPASSLVAINWNDPELNNFRQNVQGDLDALGVPDLTAGGDVGVVMCEGTIATIQARVCNRGTLPMVDGTEVAFHEDDVDGKVLCSTPIPVALDVAQCYVVSCEVDLEGRTVDVFVHVDPNSQTDECHENNNAALYQGVACGAIPH